MGGSCRRGEGRTGQDRATAGGLRSIHAPEAAMEESGHARAAFCCAALGVEEVVQVQGRAELQRPGLLSAGKPQCVAVRRLRVRLASLPGEATSTAPPDLGRTEAFLALLPVDLRIVEERERFIVLAHCVERLCHYAV